MKESVLRKSRGRRLPALSFAFAALLFLVLATVPAAAPGVAAEAGDSDPVGAPASMIFRDDELYMGQMFHGAPTPTISRWYAIPANDALTSWSIPVDNGQLPYHGDGSDFNYSWSTRNVAAASGRLADPSRDHAVVAWHRQDGQVRVVEVDLRLPAIDDSMRVLLPGSTTAGAGLDVAVGDLDLAPDEQGYYHDEIVVARAPVNGTGGCEVLVDVLDGNLEDLGSQAISTGAACSTHVAAAVGDFDGDLAYEVAVGWTVASDSAYTLKVAVLRLVTDPDSGATSLALVSTAEQSTVYPTVDLAAGAFVIDGREQIVAVTGPASESVGASSITGYLYELSATSVLQMKRSFTFTTKAKTREVRAMAGLFKYDPLAGYDVNRRQLGVAYLATVSGTPALETLGIEFHSDYTAALAGVATNETLFSGYATVYKLDMAVGNFVGHGVDGTASSPTEEIATTYFLNAPPFDGTHYELFQHFRIPQGVVYQPYKQDQPPDQMIDPFLVAYDFDGDSWKLGAPTHMVMDQYYTLQSVVQEPPKHVDYLPVVPGDLDGEWDVASVGAYSGFRVFTKDENDKELSTSTTTTSSWDIGTSADIDVTACLKVVGKNCEKAPLSAEAALKLGYEYECSDTTVNSQYAEASVHYDDSAMLDDSITGNVSTLDLWRYPIIGYDTGVPDEEYGYYETVIPSAVQTLYSGGGMNHSDFYQPAHENHNLLSYPVFGSNGVVVWNPEDLGSISYTDPGTNQTITSDRIWNWNDNNHMPVKYWDANEYSWGLDFTANSGTDTEKDHSNTMTEGLDLKLGYRINFDWLHVNAEATVNLDSKQSWGGGTTSETKDSVAKGLELEKPEGEHADRAYAYTTAVYAATNGAFKVAHAVDPVGSTQGADWWRRQYGALPDPALNLPYRFEWHEPYGDQLVEYWTLRDLEDTQRQRMRGFFLRESETDPVSGEHNLLSGSPVDGDVVLLCARIYNYSFVDIPSPGFPVNFYYYLWDNDHAEPVGEPLTQPGMSTRVDRLDSVIRPGGTSMEEVCVPWDTTGLNQAEGRYVYRFLVRVDEPTPENPEGEVEELHEGWDESGEQLLQGNNEGFYPWSNGWSVMPDTDEEAEAAPDGVRMPVAASRVRLAPAAEEADYRFPENAFAVKIGDELKAGAVELVAGRRYEARLHIVSDTPHAKHYLVTFFDGDPREGGKPFTTGIVRGLARGDNYFWGEWTPRSAGEHDIYAHVVGKVSAADREEAWATLHASVVSGEEGGGGGGDDGDCGCSQVAGAPDGSGFSANLVLVLPVLGLLYVLRRRARRARDRSRLASRLPTSEARELGYLIDRRRPGRA
ncbi:MAG: hypothetical protein AB1640_19035 [bacterium]